MTVRELFACMNTDYPRIEIVDNEYNVIWEKEAEQMIVRMPCWEREVAWITKADVHEILLRVE